MYTDIHSHILPGVDDGPEDLEDSLKLLRQAVSEGTGNIIATPHFYALHHDLEGRLELVDTVFSEFVAAAKKEFPNINFKQGFEVRYFNNISKCDALERLCIKGSRTILLELGYEPITDKMVSEIIELFYNGFNVILAHIERYYKIKGFSKLIEVVEGGFAKAQVNASAFFEGHFSRSAVKLLKNNYISFIAGDMHSVDVRPSKLKDAFIFIAKKFGEDTSIRLNKNAFLLFSGEDKGETVVKDVLF